MFIDVGVRCYYVPEYGDRAVLRCKVAKEMLPKRENMYVAMLDVLGESDPILGKRFYVEITSIEGLRDRYNIIPVRSYIREMAWLPGIPKYGRDVIEMGFVCTEYGLKECFPGTSARGAV